MIRVEVDRLLNVKKKRSRPQVCVRVPLLLFVQEAAHVPLKKASCSGAINFPPTQKEPSAHSAATRSNLGGKTRLAVPTQCH